MGCIPSRVKPQVTNESARIDLILSKDVDDITMGEQRLVSLYTKKFENCLESEKPLNLERALELLMELGVNNPKVSSVDVTIMGLKKTLQSIKRRVKQYENEEIFYKKRAMELRDSNRNGALESLRRSKRCSEEIVRFYGQIEQVEDKLMLIKQSDDAKQLVDTIREVTTTLEVLQKDFGDVEELNNRFEEVAKRLDDMDEMCLEEKDISIDEELDELDRSIAADELGQFPSHPTTVVSGCTNLETPKEEKKRLLEEE